jgi:DNA primase
VLVVEGYMDVVALAQSGVEYAVATLGTATTPLHVQKLLRQTDEIVYCFDGDKAGRRAAWRALENSLALLTDGKQVKFLFLPEGEDPDTYVRKHGKEAFEALLTGSAVPLSRFLLDELGSHGDMGSAEGRARLVHEAKPLLKQMQPNALRAQLLRGLAEKSRLSIEEVNQLCEMASPSPAPAASRGRFPEAPRVPRKPVTSLAEQVLRLLVLSPGLAQSLSEAHRALLDLPEMAPVNELIDAVQESNVTTSAALFESTRDSQYAALYQEVAAHSLADAADDETAKAILSDVLLKLEGQQVKSEYERLTSKGAHNDAERQRIQELSRRMAELKGAGGGAQPQA